MFALHFYIDLINIHRISNGNQEYDLRGKIRGGKAGRRGMVEGVGVRRGVFTDVKRTMHYSKCKHIKNTLYLYFRSEAG